MVSSVHEPVLMLQRRQLLCYLCRISPICWPGVVHQQPAASSKYSPENGKGQPAANGQQKAADAAPSTNRAVGCRRTTVPLSAHHRTPTSLATIWPLFPAGSSATSSCCRNTGCSPQKLALLPPRPGSCLLRTLGLLPLQGGQRLSRTPFQTTRTLRKRSLRCTSSGKFILSSSLSLNSSSSFLYRCGSRSSCAGT